MSIRVISFIIFCLFKVCDIIFYIDFLISIIRIEEIFLVLYICISIMVGIRGGVCFVIIIEVVIDL